MHLKDHYRLSIRLGEGATSEVWRAESVQTGHPVALKLYRAGTETSRLRRETTALRALRVSGVAEILDDGVDPERGPWIAMRLEEGRSFPGCPVPAPWADLERSARSLLGTLAGIHAHGVFHGDLKPDNVWVESSGRCVVLDFGVARGHGVGPPLDGDGPSGTLRYLPPELMTGATATAQSDLYSIGVLLHEALTGAPPFPDHDLPARLIHVAPSLPAVVPEPARRLVAALLERQPEVRPTSALAALALLGEDDGNLPLLPDRDQVVSVRELAGWVEAPDRLVSIASDTAASWHARTGGRTEALRSLLASELAMGNLVVSNGRYRPTRRQVETQGDDAWARSMLSAGPAQIDEGLAHARSLEAAGRAIRCGQVLVDVLGLTRTVCPDRECEILGVLSELALNAGLERVRKLALYEIGRAHRTDAETAQWYALVQAAGQATRARWMQAISLVAPLALSPDQEIYRHAIRIRATLGRDPLQCRPYVDEAKRWVAGRGEDLQGRVLNWEGLLAYQEGRFDVAAERHLQAAARRGRPIGQISANLNAAAALLECGDLAAVVGIGRQVLERSAALRHPAYQARAEWLGRTARYRMGEPLVVDCELVEAVSWLDDRDAAGLVLLGEAAIAWRHESSQAAALATEAQRCFREAGQQPGATLAGALAARSERRAADPRVLAEIAACTVPGVQSQAAALCRHAGWALDPEIGRSWARSATRPTERREVLAPRECDDARGGVA